MLLSNSPETRNRWSVGFSCSSVCAQIKQTRWKLLTRESWLNRLKISLLCQIHMQRVNRLVFYVFFHWVNGSLVNVFWVWASYRSCWHTVMMSSYRQTQWQVSDASHHRENLIPEQFGQNLNVIICLFSLTHSATMERDSPLCEHMTV